MRRVSLTDDWGQATPENLAALKAEGLEPENAPLGPADCPPPPDC